MLKLNIGLLFKKKSKLDKVLSTFKNNPNISSIQVSLNDTDQILTIQFKDGAIMKGSIK